MKILHQLVLQTWQKYIYPVIKNAWSKYKWHIPPFVVFCLSIWISASLINDDKTKITRSLTILGAGFAIFQFWISEINIKRRRDYDIRYSILKQYINQIDIYKANFNLKLSIDRLVDIDDLQYNIKVGQSDIKTCYESVLVFFRIDKKVDEFFKLNEILNKLDELILDFKVKVEEIKIGYQRDILDVKHFSLKKIGEKNEIIMGEFEVYSGFSDLKDYKLKLLEIQKELNSNALETNLMELEKNKFDYNLKLYQLQRNWLNVLLPIMEEFNRVEIKFRKMLQENL